MDHGGTISCSTEKSAATLQQLQHLGEQHHQQQTEVTRQQDALQTLKQVQAEGLEERLSLFGDKQADEEDPACSNLLKEAESQLEVQRQASNAANRELHRLQTEKHALETTMDGRSSYYKHRKTPFWHCYLKSALAMRRTLSCRPPPQKPNASNWLNKRRNLPLNGRTGNQDQGQNGAIVKRTGQTANRAIRSS